MKKIKAFICIVIAVSLVMSGCTRKTKINSNELKNRLIILALGIDKAEDGKILVSVQTLNTDVSSNASSQSTPKNMVKCYSQKSVSISEAISKLSDLTGKNALLSQNRLVVFGWELAKDGIDDYLDDFIRNTENRSSVLVAVSQEKAKDVIYAKTEENTIPARIAEQIIESTAEQGYCLNTRVYELINGITDEKSCVAVPIIRLKQENKESSMLVDTIAIFKNDRLCSAEDTAIAQGIILACNRVQKGVITVEYENSDVTLYILKSTTKTKASVENGKPKFIIKINSSLNISEINSDISKKKTIEDFKGIETEAEEKIKKYVENSINECIIKQEADVFGFGKRLMREEPNYYKTNISSWQEDMKNSVFSVEVSVTIKGVGDSAASLHA